jgi:hypothetical protein
VIHAPANLSRPEIASKLPVSVNTVNTHIRNIYAKLEAVIAPRRCSAPESCGYSRRVLRVSIAHPMPMTNVHPAALDPGVMDPAPARYAIRIHDQHGATVLSAFPALVPQHHGADTVLTGLQRHRPT